MFQISYKDSKSLARRACLELKHGKVQTPVFMPVGTYGAVRGLTSDELASTGAEIMLANTYHMMRRPGQEIIGEMGGLHSFMNWKRCLLTDSGGFQVFSLARNRKISEQAVSFQDPLDGCSYELSPERAVELQETFGSDIMMALDVCPAADAPKEEMMEAVERTTRWAKRAKEAKTKDELKLFPIFQGGVDLNFRKESLRQLLELEKNADPWPGMAIGGLSVGETKSDFVRTLFGIRNSLPTDRPRYLMGVGTPKDLVFAVACGVDMFDCVIPSRNARHGIIMTDEGRVNLFNEVHKNDSRPLDENTDCPASQNYSRAFLRHMFMMQEPLAQRIATWHNVAYFVQLMKRVRQAIEEDCFGEFAHQFLGDPKKVYLGAERGFEDYPESFVA